MYKNACEKIIAIYNRSGLSISKFASIIKKDRRTLTSWIDKTVSKEPTEDVKENICKFFRYPYRIWDMQCDDTEFYEILEKIPEEEVRIIDQGYEGGLAYIIDQEKESRFVIHPQFPGPAYRDKVVPSPYKKNITQEADRLKQIRYKQITEYSFESTEWYSIDSVLKFAFSPIGNFYTKNQKIEILELVCETFDDNYNKSLYLFDSHSTKVYGMSTAYISINIKKNFMFFKMPIDSLIVEMRNKKLIQRMHRYFTSASQAPSHLSPRDVTKVLRIIQNAIAKDMDIIQCYKMIEKQSTYAKLFLNSISIEIHPLINKSQWNPH